jgi:hypothetical protein
MLFGSRARLVKKRCYATKLNLAFSGLLLLAISLTFAFSKPPKSTGFKPKVADTPKIQVALLLDVSNSMDGLIDQAKTQLWNIVSVLGRAECSRGLPKIEIALYEYGRTQNDAARGYVKQIMPFNSNLDSLSKMLFNLTTAGGEEYCAQVIYSSVQELAWDANPLTYKVLFIAGNESFRQGPLSWTKACEAASAKGVIVNTIFCGSRQDGISYFWNLGAECGNGNFTNINSNAHVEEIPTPYDSALFTLNSKTEWNHDRVWSQRQLCHRRSCGY